MLPDMLRRERERWGMSVGEAGWRLGITRQALRRDPAHNRPTITLPRTGTQEAELDHRAMYQIDPGIRGHLLARALAHRQ